ncbi:hypothetical protein RHSIM_Rhsim02G0170400 [Rhododendron simsii]|uniref:hAT-like transposase RNase-H fold domain-containing protein n=1 Tax=Rhododendron simsii TaxID=118357 RepID=A0A834LT66_RHOSS|nr:hypothetical protein RHSIM_Rhsim02G0170400 [Rhododendron simsii]
MICTAILHQHCPRLRRPHHVRRLVHHPRLSTSAQQSISIPPPHQKASVRKGEIAIRIDNAGEMSDHEHEMDDMDDDIMDEGAEFDTPQNAELNDELMPEINDESERKKLCENEDSDLYDLAMSMRIKFDKYWGDFDKINQMMMFAVILDPRCKVAFFEYCLQNTLGYDKAIVGNYKTSRVLVDKRKFCGHLIHGSLSPNGYTEIEVATDPITACWIFKGKGPTVRGY